MSIRTSCCGTPLISTMLFSGAEFYCMVCKNTYGLMHAPDRIEMTPELQQTLKENKVWFIETSKDCIPHGCRFKDCDKCDAGEYHHLHASAEDMKKSRQAFAKLRGE